MNLKDFISVAATHIPAVYVLNWLKDLLLLHNTLFRFLIELGFFFSTQGFFFFFSGIAQELQSVAHFAISFRPWHCRVFGGSAISFL